MLAKGRADAQNRAMHLFTLGINHQTAPLAMREQLAFSAESVESALHDLVNHKPVKEAAILSTCNRTEVYCNTDKPEQAIEWLAAYHELKPQHITPYLYTFPQADAVKHAFRVASGLDSMVLGEPQILGQMKQAVKSAEHAGTLGTLLHQLFQRTFAVAKEVRTHTDIGTSSVSMAAASVRLAQRIFPSIAEQNVLFIGAGDMIELCVEHFAAQRPKMLTIANRTLDRAEKLAQRFNGHAILLASLPEQLAGFDIVITSTASQLPILGKGAIERALKTRKHRPMFIVDLAVPRDVEAEVAELEDVFLYTVDDLAGVVQEGLDTRQTAARQAELIIEERVRHFVRWMETREVVPTIRALRDQAERFRRQELARAERRIANGEDPRMVLEAMSQAITNKLLHNPNHALNSAAGDDRSELERWLRRIYQLRSE